MRVRNRAFFGNLFRSARLFSDPCEAWRCAPTVVFSPRLDYTLVRYACLASQPLSLQLTDGWITRLSVSYCPSIGHGEWPFAAYNPDRFFII
ncbi:BZ3500_MvSof-1268-A1-R1_Chr7-1g09221 [Microbotryum saponariae]|uniref:BZ3500_MvSof-1268-A1-R1_Chr7-1g09221 protein n=1 Tax=Microbotryum saponariae TaxID=289078 RepID=A0A2X0N232_9BASI|nr:BZ3501_MvSof-1269-A2-R1_Chr7-1g08926 [Microbotryum saponariae]SDA03025.1 BZ3500_MvSof-1268-A1-R1_Chr7-1g09221 [Microbotryum saponariae]